MEGAHISFLFVNHLAYPFGAEELGLLQNGLGCLLLLVGRVAVFAEDAANENADSIAA